MNVRILFSKKNTAKYISHLDMTKVFSRILARAEVPLWFTCGFNPHPYMVFTPPLQLGTESECEMLDIRIDEEFSFDKIINDMNGVSPNGFHFIKAYEPSSSFREISFSEYEYEVPEDIGDDFDRFISQKSIPFSKHTKRGFAEIDLASEMKILSSHSENGYRYFSVILPCSPDKTIGGNSPVAAFNSDRLIKIKRKAFFRGDETVFI